MEWSKVYIKYFILSGTPYVLVDCIFSWVGKYMYGLDFN